MNIVSFGMIRIEILGQRDMARPMWLAFLALIVLIVVGTSGAPSIAIAQGVDEAAGLDNQASQLQSQGRHADAEPLYKRALAIREKQFGPAHPVVATSLINLARAYSNQGRYSDAEPLYRRALAINEKALGPDHAAVAATLNGLGFVHRNQGRYSDAELSYKRSLAIWEKALGPEHADIALSLNNLGDLYLHLGRNIDAEPLFKRALVIAEKSLRPDHFLLTALLNNLGGLYRNQRRYSDAEPLFKRALEIREKTLGQNHPQVALSLNVLGGLYMNQRRYSDAEPLIKRALEIREKQLGHDHPDVAVSVNYLAALIESQGRFASAEPLYKRALEINEKRLGPEHTHVGLSLNGLAVLYSKQGRWAVAEPLYKRSLAIREKALGPDHPDVVQSLHDLSLLYDKQGRLADALPIVKRLLLKQQAGKGVYPIVFAAEKANLLGQAQSFADSFNVLQLTSSSSAAEAVNKLAQRYAAGSGELATLVRRDQDLAIESDKFDKAILAAVSKTPNDRNQSAEAELRKRIADIKIERVQIQSALGLKFPEYVALSKPQPLSLQETQNLLDDDEAVIAYEIGNERSYVWLVSKTSSFWTEIPATAKTLNSQVKDLRQSITQGDSVAFDTSLAHSVYQLTFAQIAVKIADKQRLSIVANGALTSIPFGLLVTSARSGKSLKETDWLIRSHAITIIPSIYSLKTMRTQAGASNAPKSLLAFGDPVFSKEARAKAQPKQASLRSLPSLYQGTQIDIKALAEKLPQLEGTRIEVETIARTLKASPTDIKLGLAATEAAVKQAKLDQYRIVYFATHGLVSGELAEFGNAKAEPALALTIPDKPNEFDDGLLQASEVAQLKLNADWVVLSACNTASSDGVGAEALSGLARAFLYAGSRSLVVSHWEVDDQATAALMFNLFEIASRNPVLSHGQALQQAMLKQLDQAKTAADAHPRMWSAFVVVGEPKRRNKGI